MGDKQVEQTKYEPWPKGCEACNNTGLKDGIVSDESPLCPVCNGSPYGEPEEDKEVKNV